MDGDIFDITLCPVKLGLDKCIRFG